MEKYTEYYEAINEIKNFLKMDLIGPIKEDEVLETESPIDSYVMGILWPQKLNNTYKFSSDDMRLEESVEDTTIEAIESIQNANKYRPVSMAISVIVPDTESKINTSFSYAKYTHSMEKSGDKINHYYSRNSFCENVVLSIPTEKERVVTGINTDDICIQCHYRKKLNDGILVTVSVSNNNIAKQKIIDQSEAALFQCQLELLCEAGFEAINSHTNESSNPEDNINDMLYKHIFNYAYGHGCAVECDEPTIIRSTFMPMQRVKLMMPSSVSQKNILYMKYWRNASRQEAIEDMRGFISEYREWYRVLLENSQEQKKYKKAAEHNLRKIEICIERLEQGVLTLKNNDIAWQAFLHMNEAMLQQRVHTKNCSESTVMWYPFQFAYILQIIPDIADEASKYRELVDLLWFPTGGGKTEAYLGVCAFVIFYRRLSNNELVQDGVTIFMRYTLRLLTLQQFERASALICACEYLRRKHKISGGEINIGLWIGASMTPNHLTGEQSAEDMLNKLINKGEDAIKEGNPVQVTKCPWCGCDLSVHDYSISNFMNVGCPGKKCEFHKHLPIYLIDDDIYSKRPTLVLSTVDKFARLVWESDAKNIFCPDDVPSPDLILQDELHLISGPLGSLTGAYETAVDMLCSSNGRKPKIIASTATVCHAAEQIKALYDRDMFQFPPSGLDVRDSFFAKEADDDQRPSRSYVGLTESGGSLADLIIRVYAVLFFSREYIRRRGYSEKVVDQYFTVVGYFNAIKDLGSAASILNDRILAYMRMLITNKLKTHADSVGLSDRDIKRFMNADELTSRKGSKEIKATLDRLSAKYTEDKCYSYILASNMLSVGIDIDRLGVMTMYNQPKTNAEYIQATSRVGRSNPGIVIDMFNNQRARDKSHYENFMYYHRTFYKYVEATSVTPFSARAIERTLQGVFIGMVRHTLKGMNENASASGFNEELPGVAEIKEKILERVRNIYPQSYDYAKEWLDEVSYAWQELAEEYGAGLVYYKKDRPSLLNSEDDKEGITEEFPLILNSLRNVEPTSNVYIKNRRMKKEE